MPFSELQRIARGNLESTQTKMSNCSTDLVFSPDNEFMELVCENGQILMQAQSGRNRKNLSYTGLSSFSYSKDDEEKHGGDAATSKGSRFGNMDAGLNDYRSVSGLSGHTGLGVSGEIVPSAWLGNLSNLSYTLDDSLQHDYCSEFFSDLTGVNMNVLAVENNAMPIDKNSSYAQMITDSNIVSVQVDANPEQRNATKVAEADPETSRPSSSPLCHSQSKDGQSSVSSLRPKLPDFSSCNASNNNNSNNNNNNNNNNHQASFRNSSQTPGVSLVNTKMQKHDPGPSSPTIMGLMNFSHFSRPAAVAKANLQNINVGGSPGSSLERLRSNEKIPSATSNPAESILIDLTSCSRNDTAFQSQPVSMPGNADIKSFMRQPPKELPSAKQSGALCREDATRITTLPDKNHRQISNVAASTTLRKLDTEKEAEPVVASSSICSGNSVGAASNDPKRILKRKSRETEENEYHSEDVEDESVGVRKPAPARGGMGAKRSRAAEVHNLSERRRRDRINEKMRALQELIPNCNKVDKASMLDEAIEYLKSLQLQVQIMSMGTGLYMPQMMLPTGVQRMHPQHLPHFSTMGVGMGMGMGMGYGMGMLDMSNGSSASPMMQIPMNGVPYPCQPLPGPSSFPQVAGSNLQMFGLPGQGLPMSMPHAPYIPPSEGLSTKSVPAPDLPGTTALPAVPAPPSSSKDPKQNVNAQMMHKMSAECSQNKTPQGQAPREGFEQSSMVQRNDQSHHVGSNGNISSSNGNVFGTSRPTGYN